MKKVRVNITSCPFDVIKFTQEHFSKECDLLVTLTDIYEVNCQGSALYWISAKNPERALEILKKDLIENEFGKLEEVEEELKKASVKILKDEEAENILYILDEDSCSLYEEYLRDTSERIISCSEWP